MNTKYFYGFVVKINLFNATECHLNPIQNTNPRNFTLVLLGFNPEKCEKVLNSFINSIIDFLSFRKKVVSSALAMYKNSFLTIFTPWSLEGYF